MELLIPFANTGDKQDFDIVAAPDGSMSLDKGFTTLFELKPEEGGLFILRREFNQLMYLMSKSNVEFNTQSFPNWIADAGSGTPYAYNKFAIVRYTDGNNYISLVDANTGEPSTSADWHIFTGQAATTLEAQNQTNDTKLITPLKLFEAFQGSNQSLTATGYQKLPGGLIIQWGIVSFTGATSGSITAIYPITFPNDTLFATAIDASNTSNKTVYGISTLSASNTIFSYFRVQGTATTSFRWFAIGY